jgi:hypothetical protein
MNNSVVFAGFTATSLTTRIVDAQAKLVIAVDVGMRVANRVPGTSYELDPVQAAFNIGAMVRWIDFNDTWLAAEWGRPSDNLGGILAVADCLSRKRIREGEKPITVRDLLLAMIQAYEIQGVLSLENGFNRFGLDHVLLVRIAWTAVITRLLGGTRQDVINALSNAFIGTHLKQGHANRGQPATRPAVPCFSPFTLFGQSVRSATAFRCFSRMVPIPSLSLLNTRLATVGGARRAYRRYWTSSSKTCADARRTRS